MSLWERIAWVGSWVAPVGWAATALLLGVWVVWPRISAGMADGQLHAWLLAALALAVVPHLVVNAHSTFTKTFTRDEKAELRVKLGLVGRYSHWRRLMRRHQRSWYRGRSHSGERPRYD